MPSCSFWTGSFVNMFEKEPVPNEQKQKGEKMLVDKIKKREPTAKRNINKVDIQVGKWVKCTKCKEILYKEDVRNNLNICPVCGAYFRMHINRRLENIIDKGTYKRFELNIDNVNPLGLEDYPSKLERLRQKTDLEEAVSCGTRKDRWKKCCYMYNG